MEPNFALVPAGSPESDPEHASSEEDSEQCPLALEMSHGHAVPLVGQIANDDTNVKHRSLERTCFTVCGIVVCNFVSRLVYGLVDEDGTLSMHLLYAVGRSAVMVSAAFATYWAMWVAGGSRRCLTFKTVAVFFVNGLLWGFVVVDLAVLSFFGIPLSFIWRPIDDLDKDLRGRQMEAFLKVGGCILAGQFLAAVRAKSCAKRVRAFIDPDQTASEEDPEQSPLAPGRYNILECALKVVLFLISVPVLAMGVVQYSGPGEMVSMRLPNCDSIGVCEMSNLKVWPRHSLVYLQYGCICVFVVGLIAVWVCKKRWISRKSCILALVTCGVFEYWWVSELTRSRPARNGQPIEVLGGEFASKNFTVPKPESFIFFWSDSMPARDFMKGHNIPPDMQPLGPEFRDKVHGIMSGSKCTWIPHHFSSTTRTFDAMNQLYHGHLVRANGQYHPYPMAALRSAGYELASWSSVGFANDLNARPYFTKWENDMNDEEKAEDFLQWVANVQAPFVAFVGFEDTHLNYPNDDYMRKALRFFVLVPKMIEAASVHDPLVLVSTDHGEIAKGLSPPPDEKVYWHGYFVIGYEGNELVSRVPLWICPSSMKPSQQIIVDAALRQPITSLVDVMPTLLSYFRIEPELDSAQWSSGRNWLKKSDDARHMVLTRFCEGGLDRFTVVSKCGYVRLGRRNVARFMRDGKPINLGEQRRIRHWPWLCDDPSFDVTEMPSEKIWQFVQDTFSSVATDRIRNFGEDGY